MPNSFIPVELAVAPNPLGLTSNLKLTTIPIDAHTCFELWMPDTRRVLLPEEAMLLRGDRDRLEEICAQLTDLLGATIGRDDESYDQTSVDCWQRVQSVVHSTDADFDAIGVAYLPQMLASSPIRTGNLTAWTLQQAQWSISFFKLQPLAFGFRSQALPIKVTIAFGQSITKLIQTAPVLVH